MSVTVLQPEWKIVDPICTFLFSVLVLMTTFAILRDTVVVLMEGKFAFVSHFNCSSNLVTHINAHVAGAGRPRRVNKLYKVTDAVIKKIMCRVIHFTNIEVTTFYVLVCCLARDRLVDKAISQKRDKHG